MKYRHLRAWFGVAVIGTAAVVGCGGDGPTASTGTSGETTSSVTGTSSSGTGGEGGAGGGGTSTGTGGTGGATPTGKGVPGGSLVSAGQVISSPKYRMVFTLGQSSPVQTNVSSPSYKLRGGLIGATGSAK